MTVVRDDAADILREYLTSHGIMQKYVAKKMGITDGTFTSHLNGRLKFTADFAIAVSRVLDISPDIFLK